MKPITRKYSEIILPRLRKERWPAGTATKKLVKKLLNISTKDSDFMSDPEEDCNGSNSDDEESDAESGFEDRSRDKSRFESNGPFQDSIPKIRRRRNSETLRAQYIDNKELSICVGTWNVGAQIPSDDLDIADWLDMNKLADVYVLGFQEIVPLNAGNIFGTEDNRPIPKWESIIRETLNKIKPIKRYKSHSGPSSPSKFKPSGDFPDTEDGTDNDSGDEENVHPINEEDDKYGHLPSVSESQTLSEASINIENVNFDASKERELQRQFSSSRILNRLNCLQVENSIEPSEAASGLQKSMSVKIGLRWPEQPLDLAAQSILEKRHSFKSVQSLRTLMSFETCDSQETSLPNEIDLEAMIHRKKRPQFVRIVSKQMVGIFLTIWIRRSLRKHVHNAKVSTVGVGAMGYIGNKGSISVSMSIYQTLFCFICCHLASGEKGGDELRRNVNVQEIHRRTQFRSLSGAGLPNNIHDHERVIWFGDLNYRINLSYDETLELTLNKEWFKLAEKDQLVLELKKGRAFDGWTEGSLNFPPTYKYEINSQKYCGEDPKVRRRVPAWCDRILSFGKGLKLVNYKRSEKTLSDHRPVTAVYTAEVEVFSHRKLQRALTYTDPELENGDAMPDMETGGLGRLRVRLLCLGELK